MPTYEYECRACGHAFEKFQSMSAAPVKVCPACGRRKVKRLLGAGAGIIFKGSGFYATDYRNNKSSEHSNKNAGNKGASQSDGSGDKSSGGQDSDWPS